MTKQNGVDVWPNAAIWMRDELRSKVGVIFCLTHYRSLWRWSSIDWFKTPISLLNQPLTKLNVATDT